MKGKGPKHERETVIRFDEESDNAEVWTASDTVYRRLLKRLGRAYLTEDGERHAVFTFPVGFIQLPRPKRQATEAQREAGRRMRQAVYLTGLRIILEFGRLTASIKEIMAVHPLSLARSQEFLGAPDQEGHDLRGNGSLALFLAAGTLVDRKGRITRNCRQ